MAEKVDRFGLPIATSSGGGSNVPSAGSVDLSNLRKVAETLAGPQADNIRKALASNPGALPGLVVSSGLAGAAPDSPLVKEMIKVSNAAIAARKLTDEEATRKIATEKFNRTVKGKTWNWLKSTINTTTMGMMAPVEFAGGLVNEIAGESRNQYNAWKKGVEYKSKGLGGILSGASDQTDLVQYFKQAGDSKSSITSMLFGQPDFIDPILGAGFFASEETGAAFAARKAGLESYSIPVMRNGKKIGTRPYTLTTPLTWVLNRGDIESTKAQAMDFIGEFAASFYADPFSKAAKVGKMATAGKRAETIATGQASASKIAKVEQQIKVADAEIARLEGLRNKLFSLSPSSSANTAGKIAKIEDQIKEVVKLQTSIADEAGNLSLDLDNTAKFLSGDIVAPIIDKIAATDDILELWKMTRKVSGLPDSFLPALVKAKSRDEVLRVFAPFVGGGDVTAGILKSGKKLSPLNTASTISHIGTKSRQSYIAAKAQLFMESPLGAGPRAIKSAKDKIVDQYSTLVPGGALVNNNDRALLASQAFDRLKIGKVEPEVADALMRRILLATTPSEAGFTAGARVYDAILKANKSKLPKRLADKLEEVSRLYLNGTEDAASYWATQHINGASIDVITINGEKLTIDGPHLSSELLNSYTFLPPAKEIMDIISRVQRLPAGKEFAAAGDFLISNVWKKSVLVRIPYIARNIMEEQFRLLLTGHTNFYTHPLAAASMWLGKDNGPAWRQLIQRHNKVRYTFYGDSWTSKDNVADFLDESLAQEAKNSYLNLMSREDIGAESVRAQKNFFVNGGRAVGIEHRRAWEGISSQIRNFHADPMARKVAATLPGKEDETVEFFLNGAGKKDWSDFVSNTNNPKLLEPDFAKAYLFNNANGKSLAYRIEELTGGSMALKSLIARGRYLSGGKTFVVPTAKTEALANTKLANQKSGLEKIKDANKEFADELKDAFRETGKWESNFLVNIPAPVMARKSDLNAIDRFTEGFFDVSQGLEKSTTMGPEYQMKYWDAIMDVSQSLDAAAMARLEKTAMQGLKKIISTDAKPMGKNHPIWKAFELSKKSKRPGVLTADEAVKYAERVASEHVAELFYNASQKRQLFHMFRLIAPFAQAWGDTLNKWSRLGVQNIVEPYKIAKTLDWMQDPKSSSLYSFTDASDYYDPNQGFFFKDPTSGDRNFFVPFLGTAMAKAAGALSGASAPKGAPFAMAINPMSFNFATGTGVLLPGFGPGVTFPIALLDNMGLDVLKILPSGVKESMESWLFPFGKPDTSDGMLNVLAPGNWTRIFGSIAGQEKSFAQAFKPTMSYLASSGDYDLLDPLDQARLTEQTTTFSKWFTGMRGFIGIATPVPAALIPIALAKDTDGSTILQLSLYEQFRKIEESNNFDKSKSYADFFDLYGPEQVFSIITQGQASSLDTYRMIEKDPKIVTSYPDIFGYVFPNGGYSQEMYKWSLKKAGGRMSVDDLKNRALDILRSAAGDRLATRAAAENWSSDSYDEAKAALVESFGGPTATKIDLGRFERSLIQLKKAVDDPRFADSGAINGAREYMTLRDAVLAKLAPTGLTTLSNKASEPQRVWLAGWTAKIIDTYPEFGKLFYAVFANELGYEG